MTDNDHDTIDVPRRTVLGGIAGLGSLAVASDSALARRYREQIESTTAGVGADSHHPGQPRFVTVGEKLWNSAWVGPELVGDRDNLAPRLPEFSADPDEYSAEDFAWSVVDRPDDSDAEVSFGSSLFEDRPEWTTGRENVAEFEADVAGTYTLRLDAPDGTHELTVHAFPEPGGGAGGRPRAELDARFDADASVFTVDSNATLAPNSQANASDLELVAFADDRDALATSDVEIDGTTVRVPVDALGGESARVHAVVWDGDRYSVADVVELHADGSVDLPNRPPEWMYDGVMYEIFTRSWAGERGGTTFDTLIEGDDVARGVDYLEELGVDVVWLTPIHPSVSAERDLPGGGPHGYDITDYFGVAEDLANDGEDPVEAYQRFVEACNERDIKVVLDVVINHCGRWMPEFQDTIASQTDEPEFWPIVEEWDRDSRHFDWFDRIEEPLEYDGEVLEPAPRSTGFWNLQLHPNFEYDNLEVREYMLAVADFWSGDVGVDGFRCDIAWGVPHSMWKEIREVVRDNDSEFLMLDETIPNDPSFSNSEFDMHFDTGGFTTTAHDVTRGTVGAQALLNDIEARDVEGFPDYSLIINAIENHDEQRALNQALGGARDNPRKTQRAVWAAGVTLPGVPFIYYGQERAISEFGEGRHMGEDDHRTGDVSPGGRKRAFMNWEEYDEDHLEFYKDLVAFYHDVDVLKPDAALRDVWFESDDDVLVFGRDASDVEGVEGPEKALVVVNVQDDPATVALRPEIAGTDEFTGESVVETESTDRGAMTVSVDTVAVLEAPSFQSIGERVVDFETQTGTSPIEPPTGDDYADGAFDIASCSVHETADAYQFRVGVDGPIENPWEYDHGFSVQHLQFYLRDEDAAGEGGGSGSTESRVGVEATFDGDYQYRVVVDGENGTRLEAADGSSLADGTVSVNPVDDTILASVPKDDFGGPITEFSIAPLMLGYDAESEGNVLPVNETASEHAFGGGSADGSTPNIADLVTPPEVSVEDVFSADDPTIPYTAISVPAEEVARFDVPTGNGYGPGTYEIPTASDYYEEAWDIDELSIHADRSSVRFDFTMATEPENPWNFEPGFSHPFFQIYVRDPDADGPTATDGRTATNVDLVEPYHYLIAVHGENLETVADAEGNTTGTVDVWTEGRTVSIEVPMDSIGWDGDDPSLAIAPVVAPFDGFGDGSIRAIAAAASDHTIGGGHDENVDPAVMDMVTPDGIDRAAALSDYSANERATLPYLTLGDVDLGDQSDAVLPDESDDGNEGSESEAGEETETDDETTDTDAPAENAADDDATATDADGPGLGIGAGLTALGGAALGASRLGNRDATDDQK